MAGAARGHKITRTLTCGPVPEACGAGPCSLLSPEPIGDAFGRLLVAVTKGAAARAPQEKKLDTRGLPVTATAPVPRRFRARSLVWVHVASRRAYSASW